jgi:hypothetical protein
MQAYMYHPTGASMFDLHAGHAALGALYDIIYAYPNTTYPPRALYPGMLFRSSDLTLPCPTSKVYDDWCRIACGAVDLMILSCSP